MTQTMLITGGSRGIGAATALLAAERGWNVAINYRTRADAADEVANQCRAFGVRAETFQADMASEADIIGLFDATIDTFGRLDSFVNNAGILHRAARVDEIEIDRLQEVVQINFIGAFVAAREAVRRMSTRHGGSGGTIVNVSSAASYLGSPNEYVDYAATKGAMDTLTIGLAKEVAEEGIRVNGVRPGLIYTEIHESSGIENRVDKLSVNVPMKRGGDAREVAEAILYFASPASSYITGDNLNTSGGR